MHTCLHLFKINSVLSILGGCYIFGLTKNLLSMKSGLPIEKAREVLSILSFYL